jgi:hypothetical protein
VAAATTLAARTLRRRLRSFMARGLYLRSVMQRDLGLVPLPSSAVTQRDSALAYARGAVFSPVCISAAVFAACVGLGLAGALGLALSVSTVVLLGALSTRYAFVRRHLDRHSEDRERLRREAARVRQLRGTGPIRLHQYIELRALVEEIERTDAAEAARFELQDLLEHFVTLAVAQQRCLDALRLAGSHDLPQTIAFDDLERSKRRREIQARRIHHREACLRRIERITDELEAAGELIRLVAQRVVSFAPEIELGREIERRLWELDEVDSALQQLSA